jgi:hypothetical protein
MPTGCVYQGRPVWIVRHDFYSAPRYYLAGGDCSHIATPADWFHEITVPGIFGRRWSTTTWEGRDTELEVRDWLVSLVPIARPSYQQLKALEVEGW